MILNLFIATVMTLCPTNMPQEAPVPHVWGLEIVVSDLEKSLNAFKNGFGFVEESWATSKNTATMRLGRARLILRVGQRKDATNSIATLKMNFKVGDLEAAAKRVRDAGFRTDKKDHAIAIGRALRIRCPDNYLFHLVRFSGDALQPSDISVFNIAISGRPVKEVEPHFRKLGFRVFSRNYLPKTLPFNRAGGIPVVLHEAAAGEKPSKDIQLVLATTGPQRAFVGPSGSRFLVHTMKPAALAFERLKLLKGDWRASNKKGERSSSRFDVIANDSCVVETSRVLASPEQTMLTVYHLHAGELLLTHYCAARNQIGMAATSISQHGSKIQFTYRCATGISSREQGHMDQAMYHLTRTGNLTAKWSWYSKGRTNWMEEFEYRRIRE